MNVSKVKDGSAGAGAGVSVRVEAEDEGSGEDDEGCGGGASIDNTKAIIELFDKPYFINIGFSNSHPHTTSTVDCTL